MMLRAALKYSGKASAISCTENETRVSSSLCGVKLVVQIDSVRNVQDVQQALEGWRSCRGLSAKGLLTQVTPNQGGQANQAASE